MNLKETLQELWMPKRIEVECRECSKELFDTKKEEKVAIAGPSYRSELIKAYCKKHLNDTGHSDIDIAITKQQTSVEQIDCEITVS